MAILGVSEDTLASHGAVSNETAREMAQGAVRAFSSDVSVAVTGIAGPGGAVPGKPVGTVCIAVSDGCRTIASRFTFEGDRDAVRSSTVAEAISMLHDMVEGVL
jgi:PncC family amidohydrolase